MPPNPAQLIRQLAAEHNFALVGIAPAQPTHYADHIRRWLSQGRHGEMTYLAKNLELRLDPRKLLPGAMSIICVADRHPASPPDPTPTPSTPDNNSAESSETQPDPNQSLSPLFRGRGRIARYAWGDDYHKTIKTKLFAIADALRLHWPDHQFRCAVDTAPILEREHAQRAGLGWVGKHTLLIHSRIGSWLLLGEIITTLPLPPDEPETDHCGTCTRCIDACPTRCISPYQLDAQNCISYLTIEHRSLIDPHLPPLMGDWIAGCDVCQEVCPFNQQPRIDLLDPDRSTQQPSPPHTPPRPNRTSLDLAEVLDWTPNDYRQNFRGSALKRIKLDMLKRNALIAAGNHLAAHDDPALCRRIQQLAADPAQPDLVRLTAQQVLSRLGQ